MGEDTEEINRCPKGEKLNQALLKVLGEYRDAIKKPFGNNSLANYIRRDLPAIIKSTAHIPNKYLIEGSPGQDNWAEVPWVCIFDKTITTFAQTGYCIPYLFDANMEGVFRVTKNDRKTAN